MSAGRRGLRAPFAIGAAALALGFSGCGEDASPGAGGDQAEALGEDRVGSVASLVQCSDWTAGTSEQRYATIADVREQTSPNGVPLEDPPLTDEEAYEMFEGACGQKFADGFRLYKLYFRANAFQSLADGAITEGLGDPPPDD